MRPLLRSSGEVEFAGGFLKHIDRRLVGGVILRGDTFALHRDRNTDLRAAVAPGRLRISGPFDGESEFRSGWVGVVGRNQRDLVVAHAPFGKRRHLNPFPCCKGSVAVNRAPVQLTSEAA